MVHAAASCNGFSCGIIPNGYHFAPPVELSVYHETKDLAMYSMDAYTRTGNNTDNGVEFKSPYDNLGSFYNHVLRADPLPELTQVCYGGVFAASVNNIRKVNDSVWKSAEIALSRGDNIEEGHLMERIWASLLANPLESYQIEELRRHSHPPSESPQVPYYLAGILRRVKG